MRNSVRRSRRRWRVSFRLTINPAPEKPGRLTSSTATSQDWTLSMRSRMAAVSRSSRASTPMPGNNASISSASKYVEGIRELDRRSQSQFGAEFVRLTCEQQDRILAGMEHPALQNEAGAEEAKSAEPALQQTNAEVDLDFFSLLALHTRQGFYSDPIYGGNKNRVGWKLIGFEGPESLAETHAGRFTTLPFFAEQQIDWEEEKNYGSKA